MLRPDSRAGDPLLYHATTTLSDDDLPDRGRKPHRSVTQRSSPAPPTDLHRPMLPRRPTTTTGGSGTGTGTGLLRSRSPTISLAASKSAARKKYSLAAFFLTVSLVTFTVQTLLAAHIQHNLGWNKAYCMLYLTHGSWVLLWPLQLCFLWWFGGGKKRGWGRFWEGQVRLVRATALQIQGSSPGGAGGGGSGGRFGYGSGMMGTAGSSPWGYLVKTTVGVTTALTVAGLSWYVAVSMTTPSDLTAIYNCSAFFAYAFSVPLLKEKLRLDKMVAVAVAIVGVLVVAYGDSGEGGGSTDDAGYMPDPGRRLMGNLVIGAGSVLYGLYEVLYKRFACPPEGTEAARGVIFANAFGSLIGVFTLFVLWIPLPILHVLGWETFEVPTGQTAWLLFISVVMNMMFSGSFLVLISLTSPVLSSVAALLTIFIVAIVDWMWTGTPLSAAAVFGGLLIIVAFGMLSWSTWREMDEEARKKQVDLSGDEDD